MTSKTTPRFWAAFNALPPDVQDHARKAYRPREPIYSARISGGCRAVGRLDGDLVLWFWIGGHDEYDRLLKSSK